MINTRSFEPVRDEPYVLTSQCEQVFYFGVPHKSGWSFVVRHDPRVRPVKYNVIKEEDIEEAQQEVNDYQERQLPSDGEEDGDDFGHADDNGDNNDDDVDDDHDHGDEDGDDHGDDGHDNGDEDDDDSGGDEDDQSKKCDDDLDEDDDQ